MSRAAHLTTSLCCGVAVHLNHHSALSTHGLVGTRGPTSKPDFIVVWRSVTEASSRITPCSHASSQGMKACSLALVVPEVALAEMVAELRWLLLSPPSCPT